MPGGLNGFVAVTSPECAPKGLTRNSDDSGRSASVRNSLIKKVALGQQFVKTGKNTFGILGRDRS